MRFVALLRGINVGGNRKVEMPRLKTLFESMGCTNVSTYINSGNVIFESGESRDALCESIVTNLEEEFGFDIPTLVRSEQEMIQVVNAIPAEWKNDSEQKTDVAYLFPEIDSEATIDALPVNMEFIDVRYVDGALFWNIEKKDLNKSRLNKLVGHKLYRSMTLRNVNTARHLAGLTK